MLLLKSYVIDFQTSMNVMKENITALILATTLKEATVASVQLDIHWVPTGLLAMVRSMKTLFLYGSKQCACAKKEVVIYHCV